MIRPKCVVTLLAVLSLAIHVSPTRGSFHLWKVQEVFTNADGSVQFIELFNNNPGEHFVAGHALFATSDGNTKTFTFPTNNLPNPPQTTGRTMLIASPGFAALPGAVTPDYTLPDPAVFGAFFNPTAATITINWAGLDSITFAGSFLPSDGVHSITDANPTGTPNLLITTNSPTHFPTTAPVSGSVSVLPSGDYNKNGIVDAADYVVWRRTRTQIVDAGQGADGNLSGTIDDADYSHWRARFGNSGVVVAGAGAGSAVPEPAAFVLVSIGGALLLQARRRSSS